MFLKNIHMGLKHLYINGLATVGNIVHKKLVLRLSAEADTGETTGIEE